MHTWTTRQPQLACTAPHCFHFFITSLTIYKNFPHESVLYIVVPFCWGAPWRTLVVFACKHAVAWTHLGTVGWDGYFMSMRQSARPEWGSNYLPYRKTPCMLSFEQTCWYDCSLTVVGLSVHCHHPLELYSSGVQWTCLNCYVVVYACHSYFALGFALHISTRTSIAISFFPLQSVYSVLEGTSTRPISPT